MIPYLDGFQKRMELIACISSVIERKGTSRPIEESFDENELDNITFSVLIHIMERSLTDDAKCTLSDIEEFISQVLPVYQKQLYGEKLRELTRYIVKDILLNGGKGEPFKFNVMNYSTGKMTVQKVQLVKDRIDDNTEICYYLTKQGFDMLFRSKEVDDELGFELEEIRLEKLIKRGNYSEAAAQSLNLIRMLNEKRTELEFFERALHTDIHDVSGTRFDELIKGINDTLNTEYDTMRGIKDTLKKAFEHLQESHSLSVKKADEIKQALTDLYSIEDNIVVILTKQRELLTMSHNLGSLYRRIIKETLATAKTKTYDIEKVILQGLETLNSRNDIGLIVSSLLTPLCFPTLPKHLRIGMFYDYQKIREEVIGEEIEEDEEMEDISYDRQLSERRIQSHREIVHTLFEFSSSRSSYTLSDFWKYIRENKDVALMCEEKRLIHDMLSVYETGTIDIDEWRLERNQKLFVDTQDEFDLSSTMKSVEDSTPDMFGVKTINISTGEDSFAIETDFRDGITGKHCKLDAVINNMRFEVTMNDG